MNAVSALTTDPAPHVPVTDAYIATVAERAGTSKLTVARVLLGIKLPHPRKEERVRAKLREVTP